MYCAIVIISHAIQIHLIKNVTRLVSVHLVFDCFIGRGVCVCVCVFKVFVDDETLASTFMCLLL